MNRAAQVRLAWVGGIVAALAVGTVAGRATFVPPQVTAPTEAVQTYTVEEATVGSSMPFPATVRWPSHPVATGGGTGTVTSVAVKGGDVVEAGAVLYTVDLRAVVVAQGAVPAFRDLAEGVKGDDVTQLQQLLAGEGFLTGRATGTYDTRTAAAVRAWQKSLGQEPTGAVLAGDVVFVATLPARVLLDEAVRVGARLAPEDETLSVVEPAPQFTIEVGSGQQGGTVPTTGSLVEISGPGEKPWAATVAASSTDEGGTVTLALEGADGAVCGAECSLVPFSADTLTYPARVILAPDVTGPAVPLAAVGTAADGSQFVSLPDGTRTPVTLKAADGSRAVVDGIEAGEVVLLFADPGDAPAGNAGESGDAASPSATS